MTRVWQALIRLDKWVNDKLLKGRWETISGRCHRRMARYGHRRFCHCRWLCKLLHRIDKNHCRDAYFEDRRRNPGLPWL